MAKKNRSATAHVPTPKNLRAGVLMTVRLLFVAAMGISAYLAWLSLTGGQAVGCGPDSGCDQVLHSRWAYWFGLPVSMLALGIYSLILGASFRLTAETPDAVRQKTWGWLIPSAMVVLGAALWFVGLQALVVKAFCPFCMAAHACGSIAALMLLLNAPLRSAAANGVESKQALITRRSLVRFALIAVAGVWVLIAGQVVSRPRTGIVASLPEMSNAVTSSAVSVNSSLPRTSSPAPSSNPPPVAVAQPQRPSPPPKRLFPVYGGRFEINLDEAPLIGAPTNQHVIVSLFDYTCHHCREMHPRLLEAQQKFSNSLVIVNLPMPLDPGCNPTVKLPSPMHTNACHYAILSLAVWRADRAKHREFDDWIFAPERPPPIAAARQRAVELIGAAAFDKAMRDPWVAQQLEQDVAIYEAAYNAKQGNMPQLILGQSVAVGIFPPEELYRLLGEHLGLKAVP
jgi:uncharacterized membrane protein/thiol-disulfide isomerase/thioredoxin